jgi:hypothetical protein
MISGGKSQGLGPSQVKDGKGRDHEDREDREDG